MGLPQVIPPLPEGATMAIWPLAALTGLAGGDALDPPLYVSGGKWLHPLFDLLERRGELGPDGGELFLRDRVIGRAAAFLILRAGIRHAWADVVSEGASALFEAEGAFLGAGVRIPAIDCRTESLLRDVDDPELAWSMLMERRRASLPRPVA